MIAKSPGMLPILIGIPLYFAMVALGQRALALIGRWVPGLVQRRPDGQRSRSALFFAIFIWAWITWLFALALALNWTVILPTYPLSPLEALLCLGAGALLDGSFRAARRFVRWAKSAGLTPRTKRAASHREPIPEPVLDPELATVLTSAEAADVFGSARHFEDTVRQPGFLEAWLSYDECTLVLEHLLRLRELDRVSDLEEARQSAKDARIRINMLRLAALEAGTMGEAELLSAAERLKAGVPAYFAPIVESGQHFWAESNQPPLDLGDMARRLTISESAPSGTIVLAAPSVISRELSMNDEEISDLHDQLLILADPTRQLNAMISAAITTDDLYLLDILAAKARPGSEHEEHLGQDPVCAACGNLGPSDPLPNLYWHPLCAMDHNSFPAGPLSTDTGPDPAPNPAVPDSGEDDKSSTWTGITTI